MSETVEQAEEGSRQAVAFQAPPPQQDILAIAIANGVTVDGMRDLMEMQKERIADEELRIHARAMAEFGGEIPEIPHNKKVMNKDGRTIRYTYADLDQILKHVRPALAKHGLSVTFDAVNDEGLVTATCYVRCGGAVTQASFPASVDPDAFMTNQQKIASATKFAMRNACNMALGLTSTGGEDDDGVSADQPSGDKLLAHVQWVKDNWDTVVAIKAGIAVGDLSRAAECWFELENEEKLKAFFADSKGCVFKKPEQTIMRSKEFREAHYGPTETKT